MKNILESHIKALEKAIRQVELSPIPSPELLSILVYRLARILLIQTTIQRQTGSSNETQARLDRILSQVLDENDEDQELK